MRETSGNALDHDDTHFMMGLYGREEQIDNTIQELKSKGRNGNYGVSVREFRMFEVTTHPDNEDNIRELLTDLHSPNYFKRAFGNAVDKILRLAQSIAPINSFKPAPRSQEVPRSGVFGYIIGEHKQHSDMPALHDKETLSINDVEVTD